MKILLVDDHKIIIDGIITLLQNTESIDSIEFALNAKDALIRMSENVPDLVLLDISLPDKSGFDLCKELKDQWKDIKIIALTMHSGSGYINRMIKKGVDGYILKNTGKKELIKAIHAVMDGERYFSAEVIRELTAGSITPKTPKTSDFIQKLTRREKEILGLIVDELTTEQIGEKLFISPSTVVTHRKSLLRKLNAKNTAGLVRKVYEFGLLK